MLCHLCKKNTATVHLQQIRDGEAREIAVCEQCAAQHGFDLQAPLATAEMLFGVGLDDASQGAAPDKACRGCHMRGSDFRKTSRLGCAQCYETFADELRPMLTAMHKGSQHIGKVPPREVAGLEMARLRQALDAAVNEQRFEDAARLRDSIRELRATERQRPGA